MKKIAALLLLGWPVALACGAILYVTAQQIGWQQTIAGAALVFAFVLSIAVGGMLIADNDERHSRGPRPARPKDNGH